MKLIKKFLWIFTFANLLFSLISGLLIYQYFSKALIRSDRDKNLFYARSLASDCQAALKNHSATLARAALAPAEQDSRVLRVVLYDAGGRELYTIDHSRTLPDQDGSAQSALTRIADHQDIDVPIFDHSRQTISAIALGKLRVQISLSELHSELRGGILFSILSSISLTIFLCAILFKLLRKSVLAPIRTLQDAVGRIERQEEYLIDMTTGDEFEELAIAFNDLSVELSNRKQLPDNSQSSTEKK